MSLAKLAGFEQLFDRAAAVYFLVLGGLAAGALAAVAL